MSADEKDLAARSDDPVRDVNRVAGHFAQHMCDDWLYPQIGERLSLAGDKYAVMYPEEFAPLFGWDEDDEDLPTVLRRDSDGAYFEVDVEVTAKRINPKAIVPGRVAQSYLSGLPPVKS